MQDYITILKKAVGDRLSSQKKTQIQIADELNINQSQVSKILTGKQATPFSLETLAEHIGVTFSDLRNAQIALGDSVPLTPKDDDNGYVGNHLEAQREMKNRIDRAIQIGTDVNINVIAVALRFTWDFFESEMSAWVLKMNDRSRLCFNLAIVDPELLGARGLDGWRTSALGVKSRIESFVQSNYDPRIEVTLFSYENIPHWHGMLINASELFMGRTRWNQDVGGKWQLSVGQEAYRLYLADQAGGLERIRMFSSWFDWYHATGKQITTNRQLENPPLDGDLPGV